MRVSQAKPKTPVVMSDGSKKAIRDVRIGDKVLATDPKTGKTKAKSVELLHFNRDRDLTDVKVAVRAGSGGSRTSVLHTTQTHPFWDKTDRKWVLAASLVAGHQLRTLDGRAATVTAVRNYDGAKDMRDLTIEDLLVEATAQPDTGHRVVWLLALRPRCGSGPLACAY